MSAAASTEGALVARELRVVFGPRAVLDGVSASFRAGEVTAVLGPNGAGKSTLLACLAGLRKPAGGVVSLAGRALGEVSDLERARRLGFLPQAPEIAWSMDVETLVGLGRLPHRRGRGPGPEDRAAVARALAAVEMTDFAHRDATTLSGGERARVLLARALAGEPRWLLADEPLAGLDPGHQFDACALFRRAAGQGLGVVLTLHDLPLAARVADRVLLLHQGRCVADGSPDEVLTPERIAAVYGVSARRVKERHGLRIELLGRLSGGEKSAAAASLQGEADL